MSGTALICYYHRHNRYGFNALTGALEQHPSFAGLSIDFPVNENGLFTAVTKRLLDGNRAIVAFSFFSMQAVEIERLAGRLRKSFGRKIWLVAGGPHPTGDPESALAMGFDAVVVGEGEETFPELLSVLEEGRDLREVKGIAFRDSGGTLARTGRRKPVNLDRYPPFGVAHKRFGPIELTRGCPFGCAFCQATRLVGARPRHRSIDAVAQAVSILKKRNMLDIRFSTPDAFAYGSKDGRQVDPEAVETLLRTIRDIVGAEGRIFFGSFPAEIRPEHVTEEMVDLVARYADNDNLVFGAQSGSQRVLDLCRRGHTVEDVYRAVEIAVGRGFKTYVDFIIGLPGETDEDALATVKMIMDMKRMGARVHLHSFMPLPQTPFGKEQPAPVAPAIRKTLNALVSSGEAFGNWVAQERMARKMMENRRHPRVG